MKQFPTIGVAGAGAWGLALANAAASAGRSVAMWGRDAALMRGAGADAAQRAPARRRAGAPRFASSADMRALDDCDAILVAVPAQATREAARPYRRDAVAAEAAGRLRQGHRARRAIAS